MNVMILDSGNSIIKAIIARRERGKIAFPQALRPNIQNEYSNILARASVKGISPDCVHINGKPYGIGECAERLGLITQRA